jgi:hypothetical protein
VNACNHQSHMAAPNPHAIPQQPPQQHGAPLHMSPSGHPMMPQQPMGMPYPVYVPMGGDPQAAAFGNKFSIVQYYDQYLFFIFTAWKFNQFIECSRFSCWRSSRHPNQCNILQSKCSGCLPWSCTSWSADAASWPTRASAHDGRKELILRL